MAQQSLQSHETPPLFASTDLGVDDLKAGLLFPDEETVVTSILNWGEKALCPLTKARREKGLEETNGRRRGRRCLDCPHGRKKMQSKSVKGERPVQNLKYTKVQFDFQSLFFQFQL